MDKLELIDSLARQVDEIKPRDETALDAAKRRAEMLARNLFGSSSRYLVDLGNIQYHAMWASATTADKRRAWTDGVSELRNVIATMREEILLFDKPTESPSITMANVGDEVFIVHGHDQAMKEAVARILTKLGLEPIILHEQPSEGKTVIEKFVEYAQVGYAVVLLSPDDFAYERQSSPENATLRARQNVVFELGYFVGRLGRERVLALHREEDRFEMPSDYSGVLFVPFDPADRWQFDLVRELRTAGYDVDANILLE